MGDFNGDGKTDILRLDGTSGSNTTIFYSTGIGFTAAAGPSLYLDQGAYSLDISRVKLGDYNGDGRMDVLRLDGISGSNTTIYYSTGTGFSPTPGPSLYLDSGAFFLDIARVVSGDFNGDGRTDILRLDGISGSNTTIYYASGNGFSPVPGPELYLDSGAFFLDISRVKTGNFSGDGRTEILRLDGINGSNTSIRYRPDGSPDLLTEYTNTTGGVATINYKLANQFTGAIAVDSAVFPILPNASPRQLVTTVTQSDGRGSSYTTTYQYHNGKIRTGTIDQQKDSGFEWVKTTDSDGQSTIRYYDQSDPDDAGKQIQEQKFDAAGVLISDTIRTITKLNPYNGTIFLGVAQDNSLVYEGGNFLYTHNVTNSYDGYGNIVSSVESISGTPTVQTQSAYSVNLAQNILNRKVEEKKLDGQGVLLSWEKYIFDAPCGLNRLCQKQFWLDKDITGSQNRFLTENYEYSAHGNITRKINPLNQSQYFQYDSDYATYPVLITNNIGQRLARTYDARNGQILTETDVENSTSIENAYDVFGRLMQQKNQAGVVIKQILFNNGGDPNSQNIETRLTDDSGSGFRYSKEYTDGLNRTYRKANKAYTDFSGNQIDLLIDSAYSSLNRKSSESTAYLSGTTPKFTQYLYDSGGRNIHKIFPENTSSNTTFAVTGNYSVETITDVEGQTKSIFKDGRGRIAKIVEAGSVTVQYTFDALGRVISATDADGLVTTMEYDSLSRKIKTTEPNTGTYLYKYDDAANLIGQTDPKSQTLLFNYDAANRLVSKALSGSAASVVYTYDTAANYGVGRLAQVADNAGIISYNYDIFGNMVSWSRAIDGYTFTFVAEYDVQNRLRELKYPDGYRNRNLYADSGYLRQVRMLSPTGFFGSAVVTYAGPESGNLTEFTRSLGNGVVSKIGYETDTNRPTYLKTTLQNNQLVQSLSYTYSPVGNIEEITDEINSGRSETFTYDNLYRVTSAQSGMYGALNYAYSAGGNLTSKEGVDFTYNQQKLISAGANTYSYDSNGNMISREGRDLFYDAENRLATIQLGTTVKNSFTYAHTGERIKKVREDGTITYFINGLYEVLKKPDGSELHTKYFTGFSGERIMQITKDKSQVTLAGVSSISQQMYLASIGSPLAIINAVFDSTILMAVKLQKNKDLVIWIVLLLVGIFISIRVYSAAEYNFRMAVAAPLCAVFLITILPRCSGNSETSASQPTWSDVANAPVPGGLPDLSTARPTYSDTTLAGQPIIGVFFIVPNHLGSISMLTDATGNAVVNEMRYKPYGELINTASSGPDISRLKYTAQESDDESSLIYMRARYYDPKLGRMLTADSVVPRDGGSLTTEIDSMDLFEKGIKKSHEAVSFIDKKFSGTRSGLNQTQARGMRSGSTENLTRWLHTQTAFSFLGLIALGNANPLDIILNQSRNYIDLSSDKMSAQNFNRFLYAKGNPIRYTDPSGHNFWDSIGDFFKKNAISIIGTVIVAAALVITAGVGGWAVLGALAVYLAGPYLGAITGAGLGLLIGFFGHLNDHPFQHALDGAKAGAEAGLIIGAAAAVVAVDLFAPELYPMGIAYFAGISLAVGGNQLANAVEHYFQNPSL